MSHEGIRGGAVAAALAIMGLLPAFGCGNPQLEDVRTGVYFLEVEALFDDCDPARATGSYEAAIEARPDGLTLWVPTGTVIPRLVAVELDEDLETRLPAEPLPECEGGERTRKVTVTGTSSESVGASVTDTFAGLAACPSDSFSVPSEDCRSERRLRYRRREACGDGCGIAAGPEGSTFRCECAGGGGDGDAGAAGDAGM